MIKLKYLNMIKLKYWSIHIFRVVMLTTSKSLIESESALDQSNQLI